MYSYGLAWATFSLLGIALAIFWRNNSLSLAAIVATVATAVWGAVVALGTLLEYPPVMLMQAAEFLRNGCWIFVLLSIYGERMRGQQHALAGRRWVPRFVGVMVLVFALLFCSPLLVEALGIDVQVSLDATHATWLILCLVTLVLLEQVYRNSSDTERWSIKYLVLGLGVMYGYDFVMAADAMVQRRLNPELWQARGGVVALVAPLLAVAVQRSYRRTPEQRVSRHLVFHTFILLVAGVYLVFIALAGYLMRYMGGSWGGALQIGFLVAAVTFLLTMFLSSRVRARLQVWISKNFFSYRYDYRREWLDFSRALADGDEPQPRTIIEAMAGLANCRAGVLWARSDTGAFSILDQWQMGTDVPDTEYPAVTNWLERTGWIIDVMEWLQNPGLYQGLEMPRALAEAPGAWLVIPLQSGTRLQGVLLMRRSGPYQPLNWEDRDLIKVAGHQAANKLAQYQANRSLVELRQFEAFNRLAAYVAHDLKNILAQQSLLVDNSRVYRDDPEFVDDAFKTIEHSVKRMRRLMEQMRSGQRGADKGAVDTGALLEEICHRRAGDNPAPQLTLDASEARVLADRDQLANVFGHLVQNAQEATPDDGSVAVTLGRESGRIIVEVKDTGCGMDEAFLRERLFKPFDTTKGLTGMGIGVVESRDVIRGLGGEMEVTSAPGKGSVFRVSLPEALTESDLEIETGELAVG